MFSQHIRYNIFKHIFWVRWIIIVTLVPLAILIAYLQANFFNESLTEERLNKQIAVFLFLTVFIIAYNLIFYFLERLRKRRTTAQSPKNVFKTYFLKILFFLTYYFIFDIIAVIWAAYATGGSSSPFLVIFFLIPLFGAAVHSFRAVINIGIFNLIFVNTLFFLDQSGTISVMVEMATQSNCHFKNVSGSAMLFGLPCASPAESFHATPPPANSLYGYGSLITFGWMIANASGSSGGKVW